MPKKQNIFSFVIFSVIKSFIFSLLFTIVLAIVLGYILGYSAKLVRSGSAEPDIKTHSLVIAKKIDPTELQIGDYITFVMGEGFVTHRIVSIDLENEKVYCSDNQIDTETGEYNMEKKQTVPYNNIVGKVVYSNFVIGECAFIFRGTISTIQRQPWILIGLFGTFVLLLYVKEKCDTTPVFIKG